MRWNLLDVMLDSLLLELLRMRFDDEGLAVTTNVLPEQKLTIIRQLAFARKPSDDWFATVTALLKDVEAFRPARNRYVHDLWTVDDEDRLTKHELKARFVHDVGAPTRQLRSQHQTVIAAAEIWQLADRVNTTAGRVAFATASLIRKTVVE